VSKAISRFRTQARISTASSAGSSSDLDVLLSQYPDLANDVSTGGALSLHTCGMSRENQHATPYLIGRGADLEALDTSGAQALLDAGAGPYVANAQGGATDSPMEIAL
jgi:hypothetical protein